MSPFKSIIATDVMQHKTHPLPINDRSATSNKFIKLHKFSVCFCNMIKTMSYFAVYAPDNCPDTLWVSY